MIALSRKYSEEEGESAFALTSQEIITRGRDIRKRLEDNFECVPDARTRMRGEITAYFCARYAAECIVQTRAKSTRIRIRAQLNFLIPRTCKVTRQRLVHNFPEKSGIKWLRQMQHAAARKTRAKFPSECLFPGVSCYVGNNASIAPRRRVSCAILRNFRHAGGYQRRHTEIRHYRSACNARRFIG